MKIPYKIEIYSAPFCHYCHSAKDFLTEKGYKFTDFNVLDDIDKRKEMQDLSGQLSIPVIVLKNGKKSVKVLTGFDKKVLGEALES
jgi:glutaredoxin